MANKPYRNIRGFDQAPDGLDYKDLVKRGRNSLSSIDTAAATAVTVVYSTYSFPLTTAGDILGHDGTNIVRKAIGTQDQFLNVDTSEADGTKIKWKSLNTTKGDLLGHNGTANIRVAVGSDGKGLHALASDAEGVEWAYDSSFPGDIIFGLGDDGSLTLVANTTLASLTITIANYYYEDVDLVTYTLTQHGTDQALAFHVAGTLTGSSGCDLFLTPVNAGTTGGTGAGGGGSGGIAGTQGYWMKVMARTISGSARISANGGDGTAGANATVATSVASGANGGTGTNTCVFRGGAALGNSGVIGAGSGGVSTGAGGAGGTGTATLTDDNKMILKLPSLLFFEDLYFSTAGSGDGLTRGSDSDGAGAGGRNTGAQGAGGGGSAGGAFCYFSQSVNGSNGGAGNAGAAGSGGGAGGAGASASILIVVCRYCASTVTIRANGGNGGNGGSGFGNGGGGAGGPGGGGGWLKFACGYGSQTPTLQVNGGTGGTGGTATGGNAGVDGNNGGAGRAEHYVL